VIHREIPDGTARTAIGIETVVCPLEEFQATVRKLELIECLSADDAKGFRRTEE